jgi:hypothetical protein
MKAVATAISPENSQTLESRKFQVAEVARILRLPLAMLDEDSAAATYASVEQFMLSYITHTLRPWLVRWEQRLSLSLLTKEERKYLFFEHLIDGLLRGDAAGRAAALHIQRLDGVLNADEWRGIENRNPLPNGKGKEFWRPLNMATANDQQRAFLPLFREIAGRVVRREIHDLREAARKFQDKPGEQWAAWLTSFYAGHQEFVERAFQPALETMSATIRQPVPKVADLAADYTGGNLKLIMAKRALDEIEPLFVTLENELPEFLISRAFALVEKESPHDRTQDQ